MTKCIYQGFTIKLYSSIVRAVIIRFKEALHLMFYNGSLFFYTVSCYIVYGFIVIATFAFIDHIHKKALAKIDDCAKSHEKIKIGQSWYEFVEEDGTSDSKL